MEKSTKNKLIFLIIILLILFYINSRSSQNKISSANSNITVGRTVKYFFYDGFGDCIEYKYYVDGVKFVGYVDFDDKIKVLPNEFYEVRYLKHDSNISEMILSKRITDSIIIIKAGFSKK